jgi:transmembrane sensor
MDKKRFFELLEKKSKGFASQAELQEIEAVFEKFQQKGLSWEMTAMEEDAIKSRIKRKVDARLADRKKSNETRFSFWKIAACLVLLLGLGFFAISELERSEVPMLLERFTGERQKASVTLQDGSVVHLHVNSKIRFPEQFGVDSRRVELEGEAFFEVVSDKDRPFIVETRGVKTRVLGTSFNVKSTADREVQVMVKTGKVAVFQGDDQEERQLILSPAQMASIDSSTGKMSVSEVDIDEYLTWRAESISFDLVPFFEVIAKLAKVYNIPIEVEGKLDRACLIKASYSNRSLDTVLYGLKNLVDFEYEKSRNGGVLIRYKGCKN